MDGLDFYLGTYEAQQAMYPLVQLSADCVAHPDGQTSGLIIGAMEEEEPTTEVYPSLHSEG